MEFGHLFLCGFVWAVDLHFAIEPIVEQKVVGHAYPVRLHGETLPIIIIAYVTVIIITNFSSAVWCKRHVESELVLLGHISFMYSIVSLLSDIYPIF